MQSVVLHALHHTDCARPEGPRRIAKPLLLPHPPASSRQQATCFPVAGMPRDEMPLDGS